MANRYIKKQASGTWVLVEDKRAVKFGTKDEVAQELRDRIAFDCEFGACNHRDCQIRAAEQQLSEIIAEAKNETAMFGDAWPGAAQDIARMRKAIARLKELSEIR